MLLREEAVPGAVEPLKENAWQDLTTEGTPPNRLCADALVLPLKVVVDKIEAKTKQVSFIVSSERCFRDHTGKNLCYKPSRQLRAQLLGLGLGGG